MSSSSSSNPASKKKRIVDLTGDEKEKKVVHEFKRYLYFKYLSRTMDEAEAEFFAQKQTWHEEMQHEYSMTHEKEEDMMKFLSKLNKDRLKFMHLDDIMEVFCIKNMTFEECLEHYGV